ncbi:MAG: hypothetical protein KGM96_13595 [Acidobacteriota bacterium]|nr:hypothetical protein [Acidobacteriota bacterium]
MRGQYETVVEVFEYPAGPEPPSPTWEGFAETGQQAASGMPLQSSLSTAADDERMLAEFERKLAEEAQRGFEAGRDRGILEGRQAEREAQAGAHAAAEMRRAGELADWINGFAKERERYFHAVEHEVVELALAVAARILRREAQMDPLLLTGAVRVALGQLSHSTEVRLRVPAAELDLWTEAIAHVPNLALKPTVLAGEGMRLGDCMIETELGSVDLGVRAQLGEIERGFFDRAGRRSAVPAATAQGAQEAHS